MARECYTAGSGLNPAAWTVDLSRADGHGGDGRAPIGDQCSAPARCGHVERWEGTLEYPMMAPVRRSVQLLGSALYAVIYGFIHTPILLIVPALFFSPDLGRTNVSAAALFMVIGSASFIGMLAAVLPIMSVERGSQMVFVL